MKCHSCAMRMGALGEEEWGVGFLEVQFMLEMVGHEGVEGFFWLQ